MTVVDTGIGIPLEHQDKIFKRFFKVSPSYKGTHKGYGIGLYIVKKYVSLLGGKISLTSEVGKGTAVCFEISLGIGKAENLSSSEKL
ncbi:sensor histidine kinase [Legionella tunisiensis]|uniref:sensor histidine kinase n=1 Tax=Legionella tunisiensis TaxID=1034944 RepID=UPI0002F624E5|nr:ATP-binding protein [Legionella tunisiensis]